MKIYGTYDRVEGMRACRKRPIVVHAMKVIGPFQVETLEGNYKTGKAGDYLMQGIENELYICDRAIFEKTYDFVDKEGL